MRLQSSRSHHTGDVEMLFKHILNQIRKHMVVFAVQKSYEQMGRAMYYRVDRQPMPADTQRAVRFSLTRYQDDPDVLTWRSDCL